MNRLTFTFKKLSDLLCNLHVCVCFVNQGNSVLSSRLRPSQMLTSEMLFARVKLVVMLLSNVELFIVQSHDTEVFSERLFDK